MEVRFSFSAYFAYSKKIHFMTFYEFIKFDGLVKSL